MEGEKKDGARKRDREDKELVTRNERKDVKKMQGKVQERFVVRISNVGFAKNNRWLIGKEGLP